MLQDRTAGILGIAFCLLVTASSLAVGYGWPPHRMGRAEIGIYLDREPTESEIAELDSGALFEPKSGCILGAYIDLDPLLKNTFTDHTGKVRRRPEEFETLVGRDHAMYFFYLGYGRDLPIDWVQELSSTGHYVHIALEPNDGLDKVQDDAYLRKLATDMGRSGAKIFLRFASEMNGPWTKYHGDPAKYIEKWKLLTRVVREETDNVAMLWCPYTTPKALIERYYPGDEFVDWVGVNLYSVAYYNLDPRFPGKADHPADLLRWVYNKYSSRKPIMIAEYAATHYDALERTPNLDFAIECIHSMYQMLPRSFPRVKSITYFNTNNMLVPHRKNNNYSITDEARITEAYREATAPSYYLRNVAEAETATLRYPHEVRQGEVLSPASKLTVFGRGPGRKPLMRVTLAGYGTIYDSDSLSPREVTIPADVEPGIHQMVIEAFNPAGNLVARKTVEVNIVP